MEWKQQNVKVYDDSAKALAQYFKGVGSRIADIELGLKLAKVGDNARVVEIGCGSGRDALEIVKRVGWYEGFDPSKELLKIAQKELPDTSFVLTDALTYNYPNDIDTIYAFASLLHVNKPDMKKVFKKVSESLRLGGIFYMSLKERNQYTEEIKKDRYGERMFYYYNISLISEIAGDSFTTVNKAHQRIGKTNWFTIALRKT